MATLLGIVIGAVLTVLISRYFFRESLRSSVKVLFYQSSMVFAGVDPDVRRRLTLRFAGQEVEELTTLELLVANDGRLAIGPLIEPLRLRAPDQVSILDASILHVRPEGRYVTVELTERVATISIDVFNPRDFFLIKLLIQGEVDPSDLEITIVAQNIPPKLPVRFEAYDTTSKSRRVDGESLAGACIFAAASAVILGSVWLLWQERPSISPLPWSEFDFSLPGLLAFGGCFLLGLILGIVALILLATSFTGGSLPRRNWFPLPDELRRAPRFMLAEHERSGVRIGSTRPK